MKTRTLKKLTSLILSIMLVMGMCVTGISVSANDTTIPIAELPTEAETEPVTEAPTQAETEPVTEAPTEAETEPEAEPLPETPVTNVDDYTYEVIDGQTWITRYSGTDKYIKIPSEIDGNTITGITSFAFEQCQSIEKVIIPDNIVTVDMCAFYECTNIKEVVIGSGCTDLSSLALYNAPLLEKITVSPQNTAYTSENGILFNKDKTSILRCPATSTGDFVIPDNITVIGEYAFIDCRHLTSITIGDNVTEIQVGAFYGCAMLEDIVIPDNITSLSYGLFANCTNLKNIIIGDNVSELGDEVFAGCTTLEEFVIPNKVTTLSPYLFADCTNLKNVVLHDNITYIDYGVFQGCTSLENITIPNKVTGIGDNAFSNSGIKKITIPSNVTTIGFFAFEGCYNLEEVTMCNEMSTISTGVFKDCTSLKQVIIPDSVTTISYSVFKNCISLEEIELPNKLERIYDDAFKNSGLKSIVIPDSVTNLGYSAFIGCKALESVTISKNIKEILWGTFTGCSSLKKVVIPNGITDIHGEAFLDCTNLESIDIPNTVTTIHERAFKNCTRLGEITLPNSVESLYDEAFSNCTNLKKVVILNDDLSFYDYTFEGCNKLAIYANAGSNVEHYVSYTNITFVPINIANIIGDFNLELTSKGSVLVGKTTLDAGTYSFKVNYLNIDCGSGYEFTNTVANHLYREDWKKSTTFIATGGEYTFTFDPNTYRLSVSHNKLTYDSVKLIGDLKFNLKKSVIKAGEFTNVGSIPAGTYNFKINVDGAELGGTYNYTDEISNARYNTAWKGLTTFTSTGGKYIITYNVVTNKLTIKKAPVVNSVAITGYINAELTQSDTNPEIFTTTMELFEQNYYIDMSVDGVKYGGYHYITDDGSFTYSPKWHNTTVLCAKNGTYTFTYNTATNKLTVTQVK